MPDTKRYASVKVLTLAVDLSSTDTVIKTTSNKGWDGELITASMFNTDYIPATLINDAKTKIEFVLIDASTIENLTTTGAVLYKRGLKHYAQGNATDNDEVASLKLPWREGETKVLIGTNPPWMYGRFANKDNDEIILNTWTFTNPNIPKMDAYSAPTNDLQFATKKYVDDTATGTTNVDRIQIEAIAGETLSSGDIVYLDETNGRWKKASALASATSENVLLGVSQGLANNGEIIPGGVLTEGIDRNQTGLTAGDLLYLSDTAGEVANSAGTKNVVVGYAISATEMYFFPHFKRFLTKDQQDALAGTSGTPSSTNKYVTNDDTVGTGNIVRESELNKTVSIQLTAGEAIDGTTTPVVVYQSFQDKKVYKASASSFGDVSSNVVGFVTSNVAANDPVKVIIGDELTVPALNLSNTVTEYTDQYNTQTNSDSIITLADTNTWYSIGVKTGATTGNISSVTLRTSGSGTWVSVLEVYEMDISTSKPIGVALGTSDNVATVNTTASVYTFSTPVTVTPDKAYCLVLRLTSYTSGSLILLGSDQNIANAGSSYNFPGGQAYVNASTLDGGSSWVQSNKFPYFILKSTNVTYTPGVPVWLSTTSGGYTLARPSSPNNQIIVGSLLDSTSILVGWHGGKLISHHSASYTNNSSSAHDDTVNIQIPTKTRTIVARLSSSLLNQSFVSTLVPGLIDNSDTFFVVGAGYEKATIQVSNGVVSGTVYDYSTGSTTTLTVSFYS